MRILFFFLLFCQFTYAQNSREIFLKMKEEVFSREAGMIDFVFSANDEDGDLVAEEMGNLEFQDSLFKITTSNNLIFSDGESKWIYDIANNEVMILSREEGGIIDDPLGFINNEENYQFRRSNKGKDGLTYIRLDSKDKTESFEFIELGVGGDYSLNSVKYYSRTKDTYFLKINSIISVKPNPIDYYRLPIDSIEDIIVTDLRENKLR